MAADNNPCCLGQSQMIWAMDHYKFIKAQQPEIDGLQNAYVSDTCQPPCRYLIS